jgi:hypothetical protein
MSHHHWHGGVSGRSLSRQLGPFIAMKRRLRAAANWLLAFRGTNFTPLKLSCAWGSIVFAIFGTLP